MNHEENRHRNRWQKHHRRSLAAFNFTYKSRQQNPVSRVHTLRKPCQMQHYLEGARLCSSNAYCQTNPKFWKVSNTSKLRQINILPGSSVAWGPWKQQPFFFLALSVNSHVSEQPCKINLRSRVWIWRTREFFPILDFYRQPFSLVQTKEENAHVSESFWKLTVQDQKPNDK